MSLISEQVRRVVHKTALAFREATPFRHVVIDDFFDPQFCQSILDDFPRFEDRFAINELGVVGGKAVRTNVRDISLAYRTLDDYLRGSEFLEYVSAVTGIPELLYDAEYVGGGTHENREGQSLDAHVDFNYHPTTRSHRRLNLIVYLNHQWDAAWGGALQLHSDPWNNERDEVVSVNPLFNRAVIFETTEISWHGFSQIHLPDGKINVSRKSFAIYLYTKDRPSEETAPSHATIYVPEAMPPRLTEGRILTDADVLELQQRFTRLRSQLRFLYEREKQFSSQISVLESAVASARAKIRAPLQGYAVQSQAPVGMWEDGWIGDHFELVFELTRPLTGIDIDLWVPDSLDSDQVFSIEFQGRCWEHRVARGCRSLAVLRCRHAKGLATLRIVAERTFVPSVASDSGDDRNLAWRLLSVITQQ